MDREIQSKPPLGCSDAGVAPFPAPVTYHGLVLIGFSHLRLVASYMPMI
jgi:hypothetical protein